MGVPDMSSPSARGRALCAVAGLAVSLGALTGCGLLGDDGGGVPERDEEGRVTESVEDGDVFAVKVGDCLGEGADASELSRVTILPCDEPHDSEAYFAFDLDGDEFPGEAALETEAERCQGEFEKFVGVPPGESSLVINYFRPTETSWKEQDDREILCLASDPAGQTTGTLMGSGK